MCTIKENGNRIEVEGIEYKFVDNDQSPFCDQCAFYHDKPYESVCLHVPCDARHRPDGKMGFFVKADD